jgi:hypothetical protein
MTLAEEGFGHIDYSGYERLIPACFARKSGISRLFDAMGK